MRFIGNVLWFIFGGLLSGLFWIIAGIVLHITIIGIPLGKQCFKMASLAFFPFGKKVDTNFGRHPIANIVWLIFFGWELFVYYVIIGLFLCITIIGIPLGTQLFKIGTLWLIPFGANIR